MAEPELHEGAGRKSQRAALPESKSSRRQCDDRRVGVKGTSWQHECIIQTDEQQQVTVTEQISSYRNLRWRATLDMILDARATGGNYDLGI